MIDKCKPVCHNNIESGYILLISVIVLGAIASAVAVSLIFLGLGSSRTAFAYGQMQQARSLALACGEEGLQQIRAVAAFTGTGNLTYPTGTCSYTVTTQGGSNRTITATGTVNTIVRKVEIKINQINPTIVVASWRELADF